MPLRFPVEKTISEDMKDFIRKCLEVSEETRMGWDKVFDHGILKKTTAQKQFV
jgi:calcium-dependent protein kinase